MVVSVEGNRLSFKMNKTSFSELVSELQASVDDLVLLIKESENERDVLPDFAVLVEKFSPVLTDLRDSFSVDDSSAPIRKAVESLRKELCRAETLVRTPDLRGFVKQIEDLTHDLGRSLGLVLFSSLDAPKATKEKIGALHKELMSACFATSQVTTASPSTDSRFSISSEIEIEEVEEEDVELDVIEEERASLEKDEVALQLKYGDDDKLKLALLELQDLVAGQTASCEWIRDERIVPILVNRLSSCKTNSRLTVIRILRHLASQNAEHKEKMADVSSLSVLVRSLSRDADERTETVKLLLNLSDLSAVRRRMGRIQGCIVMLVAMLNGEEDPVASHAAGKILNALSSNTQNALHMAEAGYFKPLVQYLKEGSDMSKILMATALSRMELTDQSKASLGKDGAIDPLVKMFNGGKLEAKSSSLNALHKLSTLAENIHRLVSSGIIIPLLQLLFSVTSVLMTLREPASAILARIAQSESVLVNPDVAQQMLSLLNFSSPAIQHHLLQALNSISCHPSASKIRRKMRGNGAIQLLLPFLTELDSKIRTSALDLLYTLSKDSPDELMEELGEFHVQTIVHIISSPSTSLSEKSAAVGLLSNLPITDKKATDILKRADLLPVLLSEMSSCHGGEEPRLVENIAGVLIRFTIPSDKKLQHLSVDHGVIPLLVKVLSCGSPLAKARAAISLAQLSQNSISLSKSRKPRWMCAAPSSDSFCEVHESRCIVRRTFCLVKAEAVVPLIQTLEGKEKEADDAVLDAIATLLQDEIWENGSSYLAKKVPGSVQAIVKVLESSSVRAQERALWILERIFRIDELRQEFGESAQGALVDLAQTGDDRLKPTVARLLAQLELLQVQSSDF